MNRPGLLQGAGARPHGRGRSSRSSRAYAIGVSEASFGVGLTKVAPSLSKNVPIGAARRKRRSKSGTAVDRPKNGCGSADTPAAKVQIVTVKRSDRRNRPDRIRSVAPGFTDVWSDRAACSTNGRGGTPSGGERRARCVCHIARICAPQTRGRPALDGDRTRNRVDQRWLDSAAAGSHCRAAPVSRFRRCSSAVRAVHERRHTRREHVGRDPERNSGESPVV